MLTWNLDTMTWRFEGELGDDAGCLSVTATGTGVLVDEPIMVWGVRDRHAARHQMLPRPATALERKDLFPDLLARVQDDHPFRGRQPRFKDWTEGCYDDRS